MCTALHVITFLRFKTKTNNEYENEMRMRREDDMFLHVCAARFETGEMPRREKCRARINLFNLTVVNFLSFVTKNESNRFCETYLPCCR